MDLKDANLGDKYRVYLNDLGEVVDRPTKRTIVATIIAKKKPDYPAGVILGWKENEPYPTSASARKTTAPENDYVPDQALYRLGQSAKLSLTVAVKLVGGIDGMPCRRCAYFYTYAEPNQNDGTLLCWSCRH